MPTFGSISLNDYDGQTGVVGFRLEEATGANFVALATAMGDIRAGVEGITIGTTVKSEMSIIARFAASDVRATDPTAQRGNKWRVVYTDDQPFLDPGPNTIPNPGYRGSFDVEIPTADLTLRVNNSDIVYSNGVGVDPAFEAFVLPFITNCRSPYSGTVAVNYIEAVTRSGG